MWKFIFIDAQLNYNDYNKYTRRSSLYNCYYNKSPFERYHGLLLKIFRLYFSVKLNNKISIPFKGFFNSFILDDNAKKIASSEEKICFIFDGSAYRYVTSNFCGYLRKKYTKCRIVFMLDGKVEIFCSSYRSFSIELIKKEFDYVLTYNPIDADKYSLIKNRPKVIEFNYAVQESKINSDVFFVGAAKDRIDIIHKTFDILHSSGLRCDFYIIDVPEEKQIYKDVIHYNQRIPYSEVLSKVATTKCVLNILEKGNSGITLRDYEAIAFGKLLITDNSYFRNSELYDEKCVIFIEDLVHQVNRIKKMALPLKWNASEEYSYEMYYKWLGELLDNLPDE